MGVCICAKFRRACSARRAAGPGRYAPGARDARAARCARGETLRIYIHPNMAWASDPGDRFRPVFFLFGDFCVAKQEENRARFSYSESLGHTTPTLGSPCDFIKHRHLNARTHAIDRMSCRMRASVFAVFHDCNNFWCWGRPCATLIFRRGN